MGIRLEAGNRGALRLDMDNAPLAAKYARDADTSEKAAASSAANAANSEAAAASAKTAAETARDAAAASATAAAASAAAIEEYEHDAEAWAVGKRGGVNVGSGDGAYHNNSKYYAEQAASEKAAAQTAAGSASTSASNAANSAGSAAGSASAALSSAASAGQKASDASNSAASAATSAANAASSATAAQAAAASLTVDSGLSQTSTNPVQNKVITGDLLKAFPTGTASGSIAGFSDGADGLPVKDMLVNIDPVQSGSGVPSPANVRPISGWTGCNIHVSPTQDAQDGDTYAVSWQSEAGTVYGGTLNPVTGVLLVNKEMFVFDGSDDEEWVIVQAAANYARIVITTGVVKQYVDSVIVSNLYPQGAAASNTDVINILYSSSGGGRESIFIHPSWMTNATTESDIKAYFAEHNLQAVVTRINPVSVPITPVEIKTLLGQNNVWADTGDVSVEYCVDPALFMDEREDSMQRAIAPVENGSTASQAYAQGAYFFRNGDFCKAKTAIASGAAFTLNTNYKPTTVSAELLAALNP